MIAGMAHEKFGHVLLNCIGRLWALDQLAKETTLVITTKRGANQNEYPFVQPVLDVLNIKNPFVIAAQPTRFEQIYIPIDQFSKQY